MQCSLSIASRGIGIYSSPFELLAALFVCFLQVVCCGLDQLLQVFNLELDFGHVQVVGHLQVLVVDPVVQLELFHGELTQPEKQTEKVNATILRDSLVRNRNSRTLGTDLVSELDSESKCRLKEESGLVPEPKFIQWERDSIKIVHTISMMNSS